MAPPSPPPYTHTLFVQNSIWFLFCSALGWGGGGGQEAEDCWNIRRASLPRAVLTSSGLLCEDGVRRFPVLTIVRRFLAPELKSVPAF